MARYIDNTTLGGTYGGFLTTQWTEIQQMAHQDEQQRKLMLEFLIQRYWKPVYCYLRREGYTNDQAKDLTQGFFCDIVMDSKLLQRADKRKGRFRSFLLTALKCYLTDQHRRQSAQRRAPRGSVFSLDDPDIRELPSAARDLAPSEVFDYVWATQILDEALAEAKRLCEETEKEVHWRLFQERVLDPIVNNQPAPALAELCLRHKVMDERTASNMIITVKRCFRRVLDDLLNKHCPRNASVKDEYQDLFHNIGLVCAG